MSFCPNLIMLIFSILSFEIETSMKRCTRLATLIIFILLPMPPLWANETNYWQCSASDSEGLQWMAKSVYERAATSKAYDACKKQSHDPVSCKADLGVCEGFDHGVSISPLWQCTALDQNAKPWSNQSRISQDDAAMAAKAYCEEHSPAPDSCYINLSTCKNLNHRP